MAKVKSKKKTQNAVKKAVKKFKPRSDIELRLGQLTYLIGKRNKELQEKLNEFQRELNTDEELLRLQREANRMATKLEKLDG